jgi:predicted  nucleic acid-binding Zn-ribbon protein
MADYNVELVSRLALNVDRLTDLYNGLKQEVTLLRDEKAALEHQLTEAGRSFAELEEKFRIYKMSRDFVGDGNELVETKKRINQIVREIDKCIALLNR